MWLINTHNGVKAKKTVTRNLKKPFEKINDDFGIEILQPKAFVISPISITDYPTIKKYLSQFWENLNKRQDKGYTPYNLRNCAYLQDFEKEKIVYPETTQLANFFFDKNTKYFIDKTGFIILGENLLYLNTILASTLIFYSYKKFYPGVELGKSGYQYNKHALKKIPIPQISEESQKPFEELAEIIISKKELGESTEKEENEIDLMVYKLYNLSYEEIKIIDPKTKLTKQEYENFEQ